LAVELDLAAQHAEKEVAVHRRSSRKANGPALALPAWHQLDDLADLEEAPGVERRRDDLESGYPPRAVEEEGRCDEARCGTILEPSADVPRLTVRPDLHEQPSKPAAYRWVRGLFEEIALLEELSECLLGS